MHSCLWKGDIFNLDYSRINVMKNQFEFMMCRTDPVISSITFKKHKNLDGKPLDPKVLALLKE